MRALRPWLAIATVALSACSCEDPGPTAIPAEIALKDTTDPAGKALEALSFGQVPVSASTAKNLVVHSVQSAALEVAPFEIVADDPTIAAAFQVEPPGPFSVAGASSATVRVTFAPLEVRSYAAKLLVRSSDAERPLIELPLSGEGIAGRVRVVGCVANTDADPGRCPRTQLEAPGPLDLGTIVEGQVEAAQLTVFNDGDSALTITGIAFADPAAAAEAGFAFVDDVSDETVLDALTSTELRLELAPAAPLLGVLEATVVVTTDDPFTPQTSLVVRGTAVPNTPPQACLRFVSVLRRDGTLEEIVPGGPTPVVEPLERVIFDAVAREGCSGDAEDGSSVVLDWEVNAPGDAPPLELLPGESTQRRLVPELPGEYTVRVAAIDRLGLRSTTDAAGVPAELVFRVQPRQDIGVWISWEEDRLVDLDVHFVKPGGRLWDGAGGTRSDCHWDNSRPNWGDLQTTTDDPFLAIDDTGTGLLVENVELNTPAAGDYQVYVHFFDDNRPRAGARACAADADCAGNGDATVCSVDVCMPPVHVLLDLYLESTFVDLPTLFPAMENPRRLDRPCDAFFAGVVRWPTPEDRIAGVMPSFEPASSPNFASGTPTGASCNPPRG